MWSKMTKISKFLCFAVVLILLVSVAFSFVMGGTDGDKLQYYGTIFGIITSVAFSVTIMNIEKDVSNNDKIVEQKIRYDAKVTEEKNKYISSLNNIKFFLEAINEEFEKRLEYSTVDNHVNIINECGLMYGSLIEDELRHIKDDCPDIDKKDDLFNFLFQYIVFKSHMINQFLLQNDLDAAKSSMAYMLHNSKLLIGGCDKGKISFKNSKFIPCKGDTYIDKKYSNMLTEEINKQSN